MKEHLSPRDIKSYVCHLRAEEKSAATIEKYARDTRQFFCFAAGHRLDKELVIAYKIQLCAQYAPSSVNSMLAAVNSLLAYLGRADLRVKRLRIQRQIFCPKEKMLDREEYRRLVLAAQARHDPRLALLLQTLCSTGIRVGELPYITAKAAQSGKAVVTSKGKSRVVLLPKQLCARLRQYCRARGIASGCIFRSRSGRPLNRSNIWAAMKGLCAAAGVRAEKVFPHNLRHLFARAFYSADKDISRLADILGHSSVETTRVYIVSSGLEHERQLAKLRLLI